MIRPDLKLKVFAYLDDIIIVSQDFDEYLYYLNSVIDNVNKANLSISPEKCEFGFLQVKYLGSVVREEGSHVGKDKIKLILDFPRPQNPKQL